MCADEPYQSQRGYAWRYQSDCKNHSSKAKAPEFELELPNAGALDVEEDGDLLTVKSGHLRLVINKENWSMRYERDGELLTKSGWRDLSYLKEDWKGFAYDRGTNAYMRQQLGLSVDELIYAETEKFQA